jgi:uroporphyrinogen-III decarboxylase
MTPKERLLSAIQRQSVDRVPANIYYYIPQFYDAHLAPQLAQYADPFEAKLASQTMFGFDPLIGLGQGGLPWHIQDPGRWDVRVEERQSNGDTLRTYTIDTPAGSLRTVYGERPGHSGWQIEPLIKEADDLDRLAYLPVDPIDGERIAQRWAQMGERGLGWLGVYGIWQQACYVRGMTQMAMDPYLDPGWTHTFLGRLCDHLAAQAEILCRTPVETFYINESYVGMGLSRQVFDAFVRPYDQRLIDIAKEAGKYVLYHDCGRADALLESFVEMGIDYLEPVTPIAAGGDLDPADVVCRIGDKVAIRGGVNHRVMTYGTPEEVREEVRHCLDVFAPGGGYVLSPSAAINLDVPYANLEAFAQAAQAYCGRF